VLQLPVSSNAVVSQRWIVSPIYYWLTNCTCTKVGTHACHFTTQG
jgi:hypothetical protein